jgi:ribosomal protein L29
MTTPVTDEELRAMTVEETVQRLADLVAELGSLLVKKPGSTTPG